MPSQLKSFNEYQEEALNLIVVNKKFVTLQCNIVDIAHRIAKINHHLSGNSAKELTSDLPTTDFDGVIGNLASIFQLSKEALVDALDQCYTLSDVSGYFKESPNEQTSEEKSKSVTSGLFTSATAPVFNAPDLNCALSVFKYNTSSLVHVLDMLQKVLWGLTGDLSDGTDEEDKAEPSGQLICRLNNVAYKQNNIVNSIFGVITQIEDAVGLNDGSFAKDDEEADEDDMFQPAPNQF